ncbi:sulfite reductase subunit beta [Lactarius psammicola]|nr:sulfite reductase subunit beta [Lactarius psammicola]
MAGCLGVCSNSQVLNVALTHDMVTLTPSITAVARVAHLSSDAIVDSPSVFSSYWKSLSRESTIVTILPHGSDPTRTLLRHNPTSLLAYTTTSSPSLIRLLPHFAELSSRPIVFHIAAQGDLADALVLRDKDDKIEEVAEDKVKPFIFAEKHTAYSLESCDPPPESDCAIPYPSPARPYSPVPRYANGHPNGFANGHSRKGSDPDGRHSSRPATPTTPPIVVVPVDPATAALLGGYEAAALATLSLLRRSQLALAQHGSNEPHTVIFGLGQTTLDFNIDGIAYVDVSLLSPLPTSRILGAIRPSVRHVIVLEQIEKWTTKWTPLFLDVKYRTRPSLVPSQGEFATSPEFALGRVRGALEERNELVNAVWELLRDPKLPPETHSLLSRWVLVKDDSPLQDYISHPAAARILSLREHFRVKSRWIIGSDAWSYDLGASGIHHATVSGLNVNTLILDTSPYTARNSSDPSRQKHDIGLYAMNYGGVFVASVAVYSSYAQVLQALVEADKFDGPSIVLAYLPYTTEDTTALDLLKETKLAVDSGYWPLYRWDPSKEAAGKEPFSLDSDAIKNDLQAVSRPPEPPFSAGIDAPPLLVLYSSDGGAAEKKAKRLAGRAQARGLSTTIATMDTMDIDALSHEEHVLFVTSTAGPGRTSAEWPKILQIAQCCGRDWSNAVGEVEIFGRERSSTQSCRHLAANALPDWASETTKTRMVLRQATKFGSHLVWKALGVDSIEVHEAEPEPITNEHIKAASSYLRGTIAEGLEDTSTCKMIVTFATNVRSQGVEPAFSFMIRVRLPGGVCTPAQWLAMDQIADEHGSGHFKLTTRQTFQFHGVIKKHLKPSIQAINRALLDTLAACGDVNRTTAYHEIWLDKKLVAGEALRDFEPLYGEFYLPRKFKIAVAVPPTNDIDVFANDVGYIAIVNERGELAGFNVTAGGGMGVTHGSKKTYPRTGSIFGFVTPEQGRIVAEKIMLVQRDNGNRADRKNARLKYTIDRMGLDVFKAEVEKLLGFKFQPARPFTFDRNIDDFGWQTGEDGRHHFTCFIENGRVQDEPGRDFKTALREIAKIHKGEFRLTANQHLIVSNIATSDLPEIKRLLAHYKLDNLDFTGLRLSSSACVAFPTCVFVHNAVQVLLWRNLKGIFPLLIDKVEKICEENGLRNDSIVMRMTGCPNGCARPYVAEVAFVGKAPGAYMMLLGGGYYGQRLNKIYRESVTEPEILAILKPMIKHYALERLDGERFGDFVIRAGYISPVTEGKAWYEGMGGEGPYREIVA